MQHALGEERAATMLARITPPARSRAFNALRWMDAKTIAALVENEHPQIAALVLAHLDAAIAADVLQLLPADMQSDVIYRVATLGEVTYEALDEMEERKSGVKGKGGAVRVGLGGRRSIKKK